MFGWVRKLRGILGTGAIGAGLGAVLSGAFITVLKVVSPSMIPLGSALVWGGVFAVSMGVCGSLFGTVLALAGKGESLESLTGTKTALLGGLAGAATPVLVALALGLGSSPEVLSILTWLASIGAPTGAGLALGVIGVAKSAHAPELSPGIEPGELPGSTH